MAGFESDARPFASRPPPQVSYEQLMRQHVEQTREAMGKPERVLVICSPFCRVWRQMPCDFVVRAAQNRCVDLLVEQSDMPVPRRSHHKRHPQQDPQPVRHLFEVVRGWVVMGEQDLELEASKKSPARTAHLRISFGCVRLLPPRSQQTSQLRPLVVWVVRVS